MTISLSLFLGAVLAAALLVIFLRPFRRPAGMAKTAGPAFNEEMAAELAVPPPPPAKKPAVPALELPAAYGLDRLVLLVRDPYWLYAYWEITATKQEEFDRTYGVSAWQATRPVLRVYDVTGIEFNGQNANSYIDININEQADNWHIPAGRPNRSFCLDLGRRFPDGRFVTLLRSNLVTTPRDDLSECLDEQWMWIEGLYRTYRPQYGISSPLILEEMGAGAGVLPLGISSPGWRGADQDIN
ncbi:DUF4912 domain-containing protein [Desulfotomaculum copahuensis]|uniref:DUF4912 domain-containing protein n=1 Tax=Desulfotomaculum copahuensis TaxID=1838280 RepID=A0A1B7LGX7_9FIRM|nr:DUF4912 domain-containing protein [Desulfotomaculum copahuensis]OAT85442.1 DUF4912 domain-containing protein [Desulfotomaculum copahuensis]